MQSVVAALELKDILIIVFFGLAMVGMLVSLYLLRKVYVLVRKPGANGDAAKAPGKAKKQA